MTPRQMCLLLERHRLSTLHAEMGPAQTTAAIINWSQRPPQESASPRDFMPSYRKGKRAEEAMTEEQLDELSDYNLRVLVEAARQRALHA